MIFKLLLFPFALTLLCIFLLPLAYDEPKANNILVKTGMWSSIIGYIILIVFEFSIEWKLIWLPLTLLLILTRLKLDDKTTVEDDNSSDTTIVED